MSGASEAPASQSVEVVVKADEILELLREQGELTVAQIAEGVGEPRSSVYRLIATLEEMGFVEPGARSGGYQLGLRLFTLGKIVGFGLPLIGLARPAMEELSRQTGETAFLMVRDGERALCLERIDGIRVQSMVVGVGGTLPLHLGAGPLVLLAFAADDVVEPYLAGRRLGARTEQSVTDAPAVRRRLAEVRERGWAVSDEDLVPGIAAVGAPVRDESGAVVASLSLSGARASLLADDGAATVAAVREAAAAIAVPSI